MNGLGRSLSRSLIVVIYLIGFAVHQPAATHDLRAKGLADRLVPQTYTQEWNLAREPFNAWHRYAGLVGRAWAGRDNQMRRPLGFDLLQGNLVVAINLQIQCRIDLSQSLHQVVCEGIVIIDKQNHIGSILELHNLDGY